MDTFFHTKGFLMAIVILFAFFSCAKSSAISPINTTTEGVAIKGYDPVAYFTDRKPIRGMPEFKYVWKSAEWRFASSDHLEMFKKDPEKYAPRYGGYCAYAVSQGKTADIDPEAWTIFEGTLYLNLDKDVQRLWEKDMQDYIRKADENWPRMLAKIKEVSNEILNHIPEGPADWTHDRQYSLFLRNGKAVRDSGHDVAVADQGVCC